MDQARKILQYPSFPEDIQLIICRRQSQSIFSLKLSFGKTI